jgi:SAM-dependent methyltransferase
MIGLDYNPFNVKMANDTGAYQEVHHLDLNSFDPSVLEKYCEKFDYIIFGDVLEHIYEPQKILKIFKKYLKNSGNFLISIPNIAHASIKMSLLEDDWTYTSVGLLDSTHIRFFTHKSLPKFLSDVGIEAVDVKYIVRGPRGTQPRVVWRGLPSVIKNYVYKDPHSFILQYVFRAKKSDDISPDELSVLNKKRFLLPPTKYSKMLKAYMNQYGNRFAFPKEKIKRFLYQNVITSHGKRLIKICKIPIWDKKIKL